MSSTNNLGTAPPSVDRCEISFAVACYNAMPYLPAAIESALAQTDVQVEVLVIDDGSTDGSMACANEYAARDTRVRVLRTPQNCGPAGARNIAIREMRGNWFAVLDSDDLVMPERSRRLIDEANASKADFIADDLVVFGAGRTDRTFLSQDATQSAFWLTLEGYFRDAIMYGKRPNPGFLKPMIRREALEKHGIGYNSNLRIAEDDELIVRLLLAGCQYRIVPQAMYRYRKHAQSISHRLSSDHARRMLASEKVLKADLERQGSVTPVYRRRWRALVSAEAFARAIDALNARRLGDALSILAATPSALPLFAMPITARIGRMFASNEPYHE